MITPWVKVFLEDFARGSLFFAVPCALIEMVGFLVIGTRYVYLNGLLVVTGYMGLFLGAAVYISAVTTMEVFSFNTSERRTEQ